MAMVFCNTIAFTRPPELIYPTTFGNSPVRKVCLSLYALDSLSTHRAIEIPPVMHPFLHCPPLTHGIDAYPSHCLSPSSLPCEVVIKPCPVVPSLPEAPAASSPQSHNVCPHHQAHHPRYIPIVRDHDHWLINISLIFSSPIDGTGQPIPPGVLEQYLTQHGLVPQCMCDKPARFMHLCAPPNNSKTGIMCGLGRECSYW